jgi:dUTP pyrophosphatase
MIYVQRTTEATHLPLPERGTKESAGLDLRCVKGFMVKPGERVLVPTGFAWSLPLGSVGMIRPRSGLAVKYGIDVMAGVVDSDYRGEVKVVLINHGDRTFKAKSGDRIAQMVIHQVDLALPEQVLEDLPATERRGGFGSTGVE